MCVYVTIGEIPIRVKVRIQSEMRLKATPSSDTLQEVVCKWFYTLPVFWSPI